MRDGGISVEWRVRRTASPMDVLMGREQAWPVRLGDGQSPARVAVISVNCNTRLLIAQLIYSLRTRCTPAEPADIVLVDNASQDGSQELLTQFEAAGPCHGILNAEQGYHGPALNQAMNWLAERQKRTSKEDGVDYVWILDSDCIVIRPDTLLAAG